MGGDCVMGSVEKEKREEQCVCVFTDTLSNSVNKRNFVNSVLTDDNSLKFKSSLQRIRKDQAVKLSKIAEKHKRRSFSETLDILLYLYDFFENIQSRFGLSGLAETTEFINAYLPQSDADYIARETIEFLNKLDLQDPLLEKALVSILFKIKLKGEKPKDVLKPLFLLDD